MSTKSGRFKIVDRYNKNDLLAFLDKQESANFFQSEAFIQLYARLKEYEILKQVALDSSGTIVGVLIGVVMKSPSKIKSFFSKRIIIWGGPLVQNNCPQLSNALIKKFIDRYRRKSIYIEFRNLHSLDYCKDVFESQNFSYLPYQNYVLKVEGSLEETLKLAKYNRRREIKLTLKEGAVYEKASNISQIKSLYTILEDLYRNRVKLPLPSFSFFEAMFYSENGAVFVVYKDSKLIGGAFCVYDQSTIYTLYYCGIRSFNKKIFPTHLAVTSAIDFAISKGLSYVDFMGAGMKNQEYGVGAYKAQFGGKLVTYGRYIRINKRILFRIGKMALKISGKVKK